MGDGPEMIIGLTGLPRAGKDTFAHRLVNVHGYTRIAFADPLKAAAAVLLARPEWQMHGHDGFDREAVLPEWGFSTRWFLQILGTECLRRQVSPDFWLDRMRLELRQRNTPRVVITDCRFENEAALVRDLGGIVIEVRRLGTVGSGHVSDAGITPDAVIGNAGTIADLNRAVDRVAAQYHKLIGDG